MHKTEKFTAIALSLVLTVCLSACGGGDTNNVIPTPNLGVAESSIPSSETAETPDLSVEETEPAEVLQSTSPTEAPPSSTPIESITGEELETLLMQQPMYVLSTDYIIQDEQYKALYPDLLQAVIKNNSGTEVQNVVVAFVAWDINNLPVQIYTKYSFGSGAYVVRCNYENVNMIDGATYGETSGMALDYNTNNIATFKAIVVSYEDFDGNTWNNPYYNTWVDMYENKRLEANTEESSSI